MGGESSKDLTPRQMEDLRRQTPFTPKEIREWFKKFHEDCPSGHMTQQEFQAMYEHLFPKGDSKEFSEIVFKAYDKDGNGQIDFQEFVCTVGIASRGSIDEKLRWAFHLYDIDNNGYVTKSEIAAIFSAIYRTSFNENLGFDYVDDIEKAVGIVFDQLDKDGDDKLTEEEFIDGIRSAPQLKKIVGDSVDVE